ncbi:hypothetical protein Cgig2_022870 [Carnegiea gigantea]|uniref:DYW domain-containing protein n=1 Tax=Carnegiea gigantea TaxID=171969 RepID=A0A9Q1KQS2_9CARY|nr:hypothetical protein Cgig2_022870 [Carnegiea gigantea]
MYECKGKSKEADNMSRLMGLKGVRKELGCRWIDVKDTTYQMISCTQRTNEICALLRIGEEERCMAETQFAISNVELNKEQSLWGHSEKLALSFGLLTLPSSAPTIIKKNLRTDGDCHTVVKFASGIFKRYLIVRDVHRFHHFSGGHCLCQDYCSAAKQEIELHGLELIAQSTWEIKVTHCYREANQVADRLVNLGIHKEVGVVYYDSPPKEAIDVVNADAVGVAWPRKFKRAVIPLSFITAYQGPWVHLLGHNAIGQSGNSISILHIIYRHPDLYIPFRLQGHANSWVDSPPGRFI